MTERHFRVVQLDGKKIEIGGVSISSKASPGNAARKLLTSIAHHKGLKKNKKASLPKVKFCIQEYTQGSSKKVYGPYVGHYHKYTAAELKKAMTADGKVKFTMKPVVKLVKGMKGGVYGLGNVRGYVGKKSGLGENYFKRPNMGMMSTASQGYQGAKNMASQAYAAGPNISGRMSQGYQHVQNVGSKMYHAFNETPQSKFYKTNINSKYGIPDKFVFSFEPTSSPIKQYSGIMNQLNLPFTSNRSNGMTLSNFLKNCNVQYDDYCFRKIYDQLFNCFQYFKNKNFFQSDWILVGYINATFGYEYPKILPVILLNDGTYTAIDYDSIQIYVRNTFDIVELFNKICQYKGQITHDFNSFISSIPSRNTSKNFNNNIIPDFMPFRTNAGIAGAFTGLTSGIGSWFGGPQQPVAQQQVPQQQVPQQRQGGKKNKMKKQTKKPVTKTKIKKDSKKSKPKSKK